MENGESQIKVIKKKNKPKTKSPNFLERKNTPQNKKEKTKPSLLYS